MSLLHDDDEWYLEEPEREAEHTAKLNALSAAINAALEEKTPIATPEPTQEHTPLLLSPEPIVEFKVGFPKPRRGRRVLISR